MTLIHFFLSAYFICLFTLIGGIVSFWLTKKYTVIDVFWGIGISTATISMVKHFAPPSLYATMITVMVLLWGLRLSGFILFTKVLSNSTDQRYARMVKTSPTWLVLKQCMIQAPLQAIIVTTIFPIFSTVSFSFWGIAGVLIFGIGLIGEAISDHQLYLHKKTHSGICTIGLWAYSRHPNYFFECLIWLGISTLFIGSPNYFMSLIGPIGLFVIMYFFYGALYRKMQH